MFLEEYPPRIPHKTMQHATVLNFKVFCLNYTYQYFIGKRDSISTEQRAKFGSLSPTLVMLPYE